MTQAYGQHFFVCSWVRNPSARSPGGTLCSGNRQTSRNKDLSGHARSLALARKSRASCVPSWCVCSLVPEMEAANCSGFVGGQDGVLLPHQPSDRRGRRPRRRRSVGGRVLYRTAVSLASFSVSGPCLVRVTATYQACRDTSSRIYLRYILILAGRLGNTGSDGTQSKLRAWVLGFFG